RAVRESLAPHTMYVPTMGTGLTDLYVSVGYEQFCLLLHSRPTLIGELLRHRAMDNLRWLTKAAEERLCPMFLIAEDIGGKKGLLFSPDWLRRHFIPALKMLTRPLRRAGIKAIFHSDGNVMDILDDLVEAGIDGLHPIEPMAGMDIARVQKRYGEQLVLVGNVDCGRLLPMGRSRDIRRAVRKCKRAAGRSGGHFVGSSGELHAGIPMRNVFTFCEACRE
ncbi:MAG: uroporphyrinogen decarboxylase family protein, partial [Planctomycetota bacterium]